MNKIIIFIIVVLVIIGGGVWLWSVTEDNLNELPENGQPLPVPSHTEAELTGFNFILNFIEIASSQPNPEAEEEIYQVLSSAAKEHVARQNLIDTLATFIQVQGAPEQGASVEDLQIHSQDAATLIVGLNYVENRIIRYIHLVVEDGQWKVDEISVPENKANFKQTGNLVQNNPGMEEDVWYLIYDAPGAPGEFVKLSFDTSSFCGGELCQDILDAGKKGSRVEVEGEIIGAGDQFRVIKVSNLIFSEIE